MCLHFPEEANRGAFQLVHLLSLSEKIPACQYVILYIVSVTLHTSITLHMSTHV